MEQHTQGLLHKPQIIGISLLLEKGIYGLILWWLWMRWITGMALARVGDKGHLSMEKKICSSSKSNEVLKNQSSGKNEKNQKNEKAAKTGVSQEQRVAMAPRRRS